MPRRTLYHWLSTLGIYTNLEGYYEASDLEILKQLNRYLKQTPNIRKFKATLQKRGSYYADGF